MPKLTRQDWKKLRDDYHVAFSKMDPRLFELLLDKLDIPKSNPGSNPGNPDGVDEVDALMIRLARAEPPIRP